MAHFNAPGSILSLLRSILVFLIVSSVNVEATPRQSNAGRITLPSFPGIDQRSLDEARTIVADAQNKIETRKAYLFKNQPLAQLEAEAPPLYSINATVVQAAAVLAEQDAASGILDRFTASSRLAARQPEKRDTSFWMETIAHSGSVPFGEDSGYKVFRNVRDYGAKGDNQADDTAAINRAISDGNRCGEGCSSSTVKPALVYFPAGTYLISSPIISYYNTQLVGNPNNRPTLMAAPTFVGLGVINADPFDNIGPTPWYDPQRNFLRQIRNFIIDIRPVYGGEPTGIYFVGSQGSSVQNVDFHAAEGTGAKGAGIFIDSGSGGFLSDLNFFGGNYGIRAGAQQFTVRNVKFSKCKTAVQITWTFGMTWKSVNIKDCLVGFDVVGMSGRGDAGPFYLADSQIAGTPVGLVITSTNPGSRTAYGAVTLDNVDMYGTSVAVQDENGSQVLAGQSRIESWTFGTVYDPINPNGTFSAGPFPYAARPPQPVLAGGSNGGFYERSRPQYESVAASGFTNVKTAGAKGDGISDDTASINSILASAAGKSVMYFPAGSYIVTDTLLIPPGTKIVGECWSQIVGTGPKFANMDAPHVMVQVGREGDSGIVEITDMLFTARGATAGIVLMEWNLKGSESGAAGMWDSHLRIGGAAGTELQQHDCPALTGSINTKCLAGSMMLHLTRSSSAYLENVWAWAADHDLDNPANADISVYVARGILVESQGPLWMVATASENAALYQYQLNNAANVYMPMVQAQSPYYLPNPLPPAPFQSSLGKFAGDVDLSEGKDISTVSWGLRIVSSDNIIIGGACLWSWEQNYNAACLNTQSCQASSVSTAANTNLWLYNLVTSGVTQMVTPFGASIHDKPKARKREIRQRTRGKRQSPGTGSCPRYSAVFSSPNVIDVHAALGAYLLESRADAC